MGQDKTRRDWVKLGREDPLWAVLVKPQGRGDNWDVSEFLATGRAEVDETMTQIRELGLVPGGARALDFGCGAGRLTQALAVHFDDAVGVDFSPPMIERARREDPAGTCTFILNDREDLSRWDDASVDLTYSALVLQHIPTETAMRYLTEMVRVLRPGGIAAVQVATRTDDSLKGRLAGRLPLPAIRFLQRWVLRYPAPMDMYPMSREQVEAAVGSRGRIASAVEEQMYGGHWVNTRYIVERVV